MKGLFLGIILCVSGILNGQNLKKIIDKNDAIALQNYVDTGGDFEELIPILIHDNKIIHIHPFVYAVRKSDLYLVKVFVKNKSIFENFDTQLSIAFVTSIPLKNTEITEFLLENNPNVNQISEMFHNYNGLMAAVVSGDKNLFLKLKDKSDYKLISDEGNNLFHLIGDKKVSYNVTVLKYLISKKDLNINLVNKYERTPLHYAARSGNSELFFELIKYGAKPNKLKDLYTDAAIGGDVEVFKYVRQLIKTDPNWIAFPEMIDENEKTFYGLEYAIKNNNFEVTKIIFNEMFSEVKNVKHDDQIEIVTNILNSRQLENDQFWPLWEAIQFQNKALFEFLVRSMVKFNSLQIEYTAYNSYVEDDYTEIAEVLFTKFEYRSAKRRFGKDYVKNLYKELGISF
jgi:hypothetical protein